MSKIQAEIDRLTLVVNGWTAAARQAAVLRRQSMRHVGSIVKEGDSTHLQEKAWGALDKAR